MRAAALFNNKVRGKPKTKWFLIALVLAFWSPQLVSIVAQAFDRDGTSKNVSTKVVAEPYVGSQVLKYTWSGDVYRSCEITIRRAIIDANSYVHTIAPTTFPALDADKLGPTSFPISVETPKNLPEGEATYVSSELSRCGWFQKYVTPAITQYPAVHFTVTHAD